MDQGAGYAAETERRRVEDMQPRAQVPRRAQSLPDLMEEESG
jgi:hypothetical protein